jgi:hypothetical protein
LVKSSINSATAAIMRGSGGFPASESFVALVINMNLIVVFSQVG